MEAAGKTTNCVTFATKHLAPPLLPSLNPGTVTKRKTNQGNSLWKKSDSGLINWGRATQDYGVSLRKNNTSEMQITRYT